MQNFNFLFLLFSFSQFLDDELILQFISIYFYFFTIFFVVKKSNYLKARFFISCYPNGIPISSRLNINDISYFVKNHFHHTKLSRRLYDERYTRYEEGYVSITQSSCRDDGFRRWCSCMSYEVIFRNQFNTHLK